MIHINLQFQIGDEIAVSYAGQQQAEVFHNFLLQAQSQADGKARTKGPHGEVKDTFAVIYLEHKKEVAASLYILR